jgi:hypothetical protein
MLQIVCNPNARIAARRPNLVGDLVVNCFAQDEVDRFGKLILSVTPELPMVNYEIGKSSKQVCGESRSMSFPHVLQERQRTWNMLSPGGRGQFLYPDPGKPRSDGDEAEFKKVPI